MKTLKKVVIEPIFVEFIPEILENNKFYISEKYETCVHNCLCGCGSETVTPLGPNAWTLRKHDNGKISLTPSISNYQFSCRSHYIITKNIVNFV